MGFFSPDPKNRLKFNEIKKAMKHMDLSEKQQKEALGHFENANRDSFSTEHIKEVMRRIRGTTGDSLQSTHTDRIERTLIGHINERTATPIEKEELKMKEVKETNRYTTLNSDHLEVPKNINERGMDKSE